MTAEAERDALREALVQATTALKAAEIPFAIAGGYALYVWGAAEPDHDVDLVIEPETLDAAVAALQEAGFEIEQPPEDWLVKGWWRRAGPPAFVDVIFELAGRPVDGALLRRAETQLIQAVHAPVLPAQDVITAKLLVLAEQHCDYTPLLRTSRAIRERVDWRQLRQDTEDNPYAQGFLDLLMRLGVAQT